MTGNTTFAAGALALAVAALPSGASADGISFQIVPRVERDTSAALDLERWTDFEAGVSLAVKTDPKLVPSARVIEMVESIGMIDGAGLTIARGYAIDVRHDLVLGYSGGSAEIAAIRQDDQGLMISALFKDAQGHITEPPLGALAAYTTAGERLCFAPEQIEVPDVAAMREDAAQGTAGIPGAFAMEFTLLLDRSGSMSKVRKQVDGAARRFIDELPGNAQCTLGGFASSYSFEAADGFGRAACAAKNFSLRDGQDLGKATDLFAPLRDVYRRYADPSLADAQRAVIILSDGGLNENLQLKEELLRLRGDALTFVYFLGNQTDEHLKELAHNYLEHDGDLSSALGRYFQVLSEAYTRQTVLRVVPCDAE